MGDCCNDPFPEPRKCYKSEEDYFIDQDNYRVYNQCQNCGKKIGSQLKKAEHLNSESFDYELEKRGKEERTAIKNLSNEIQERTRLRKSENFWTEYDEYLKSPKWREICKIVLERDNYLCQSCRTEEATQVHHKDSRFRFNEPLFTLISVCRTCHDIITEIERGKPAKEVNQIKYPFNKGK